MHFSEKGRHVVLRSSNLEHISLKIRSNVLFVKELD